MDLFSRSCAALSSTRLDGLTSGFSLELAPGGAEETLGGRSAFEARFKPREHCVELAELADVATAIEFTTEAEDDPEVSIPLGEAASVVSLPLPGAIGITSSHPDPRSSPYTCVQCMSDRA
jgi:hypothetical protein